MAEIVWQSKAGGGHKAKRKEDGGLHSNVITPRVPRLLSASLLKHSLPFSSRSKQQPKDLR